MDYAQFATQGNFADFGELTQDVVNNSATGNSTRGLRLGGYISPSNAFTNTVDYVTTAALGNATDFGDLTQASGSASSSQAAS